jgi:probable phosphoglycerate mutase
VPPVDEGPRAWPLRHGATEWSVAGRHTGRTDVPLTALGEVQARELGRRLADQTFALVLVSPLRRARRTCELAGFADAAEVDADLLELDYGDYEGLTTAEIRADRPEWTIWDGPCPGGETLDDVARRADRVIDRVRTLGPEADVALFAHGHVLRVLAARWCALGPEQGRCLALDTAAVSVLGWEHRYGTVRRWNADA